MNELLAAALGLACGVGLTAAAVGVLMALGVAWTRWWQRWGR
jgi:hypothetical protein